MMSHGRVHCRALRPKIEFVKNGFAGGPYQISVGKFVAEASNSESGSSDHHNLRFSSTRQI